MLRVLQGRLHRNSLLLEQADCTYEKAVLNRYEIAETLNSIAGSLGRARSFLVSRTMCTDTDRWDCSIGALIITFTILGVPILIIPSLQLWSGSPNA